MKRNIPFHPLPLHTHTPIPPRRMHNPPLKLLQTFDLRPLQLVRLSHRTDQKVALDAIPQAKVCIFSARHSNVYAPPRRLVAPIRSGNTRVEVDVLVELISMRHVPKVIHYLLLAGVFPRPVGRSARTSTSREWTRRRSSSRDIYYRCGGESVYWTSSKSQHTSFVNPKVQLRRYVGLA
jgi:hypothetical protein